MNLNIFQMNALCTRGEGKGGKERGGRKGRKEKENTQII